MSTAVLVIDVQHALFSPKPKPFEAEKVISRINSITSWARAKDYPVIFIQHEQANSPLEFKATGWQLQGNLMSQPDDLYVRKTTPDSFLNTTLNSVLSDFQIKHLMVCGYATEFCIDTTTRSAAGLGYSVDLIADAHTTHDKKHANGEQIRQHHNCTLPAISSFGVKIAARSTSDIVDC